MKLFREFLDKDIDIRELFVPFIYFTVKRGSGYAITIVDHSTFAGISGMAKVISAF